MLDRAVFEVRKMNRLITGFLNISRPESGKIVTTRKNFDLDKLTRELIEETRIIDFTLPVITNA